MDRLLPLQAVSNENTLILLATAICLCTCVITFKIFAHVLARGARSDSWLAINGFCTGFGFWATSIVVTLAQSGPAEKLHIAYVVYALIAAVGGTVGGLFLAVRPWREPIAVGGAVIGLGIVIAHLANMTAFHMETLVWSKGEVVMAGLFAAVLFSAAFALFREQSGMRALGLSSGLMMAGSAVLFFSLSHAATINANLAPALDAPPPDMMTVAGLAALSAAGVLVAGFILAALDGRAVEANFSRLGELIDGIPDGVVIANDGKIIGVNLGLVALCGRKERDLTGKKVFGDLLATWRRQGTLGRRVTFETEMLGVGGERMPVRVVRHALYALGRANEVYSIHDMRERDAGKAKIDELSTTLGRTEKDLQRRNFLLDVVLRTMTQGLAMYDNDQRVVLANDRYAEIYGLTPADIAPGTRLRDIVQKRVDKGLFALGSTKAYLDDRLALVEKPTESMHELNDGRMIAISQRPIPGGGWLTTHDDVTEFRRIEAQNLHLTQHDPLTMLPNRTSLRAMLNEMLVVAGRKRRRLTVLMLNLDGFREVNDTLGHKAGDTLLAAVAERLRTFTRRTTLLGRFGDDEFVVVEAVDRPGRDAAALAGRVQEQIAKPFHIDGKVVKIGATIGIAIFPADGQDADLLLKHADLALCQAKRDSRGSYQFFESSMERHLAERLTLQALLADALTNGQFELHYQPLVNLSRKEITGFETLLRWRHPERGLVSPADFIPAAEAAGLMPAIGEWALRQACHEAAQWPAPLKVALNVSVSQFKAPEFAQTIISALASAGLAAPRLEIEVSESVIWDDREAALIIARRLSELGVSLALDDFGTGFSAFSSLRDFPFKRVKIDRAFVGALTVSPESQTMLRTLLRLGAGFGAAITAEGVETQEQFEFVRQEGFTEMQGYYFSEPKTAEEIRRLFLPQKNSAVA